jgi:hypothetical protein
MQTEISRRKEGQSALECLIWISIVARHALLTGIFPKTGSRSSGTLAGQDEVKMKY